MERSIDDILSNEPAEESAQTEEVAEAPPETAEGPTEEAPTEAQPEGQPRDEKGRFAPKGEDGAPPAPQEESPTVPRTALQDERRKRQELEQRLAQLEQMQQQQPQQPAPEFWDDPDQAFNHRLQTVLPEITERIRNELRVERVKESAEEARTKYQDYDETIDVFHQLASQNPALGQQMMMSRNPAEFAYKTAKTHQEVQQYGSLDQLIEAKLKEREAANLEAAKAALPASPPPTISTDRSVGPRSGPTWSGPADLNDILR